ncbi:MAG: flagellar biosynthetic protein FliR [Oscillospiraceae bacterium]|nr:flagellar biosynthetic protein FliR [Oscillospiraceae bacterium]
MFNWSAFTLFLYMLMRMSGFILFSPFFGRNGVPMLFRGGMIALLSVTAYAMSEQVVAVPNTLLELAVRLFLELGIGFSINMLIQFLLYISEQAGEVVDTQMGMAMARSYDPGSQASMTSTANLLNSMTQVLFFVSNGHVTLIRLVLTSGEIVPFGQAAFGDMAANHMVAFFSQCVLMSFKLSLPILGAELLGQMGMGILMKAIPQINVFAINIELKVLVGMVMLAALLSPMSRYLLEAESIMLGSVRDLLTLFGGT